MSLHSRGKSVDPSVFSTRSSRKSGSVAAGGPGTSLVKSLEAQLAQEKKDKAALRKELDALKSMNRSFVEKIYE